MTEVLTNPMSVDLRFWKEDFLQKKTKFISCKSKQLLFSYYVWLTYYLSYYLGNIAYPIIYHIITFTYRKVKFYPINTLEPIPAYPSCSLDSLQKSISASPSCSLDSLVALSRLSRLSRLQNPKICKCCWYMTRREWT